LVNPEIVNPYTVVDVLPELSVHFNEFDPEVEVVVDVKLLVVDAWYPVMVFNPE
jgi:hypothetical protein